VLAPKSAKERSVSSGMMIENDPLSGVEQKEISGGRGCCMAFRRSYLKENNFELSRGRFIGGQLNLILWTLLAVIALIGFIILALSFLVFLLNFQLLIAQSARDIRFLLQQGYPLWDIRKTLHERLLWMYGGVWLAALVCLWGLRSACLPMIREQGFVIGGGLHWWVWVVAGLCGVGLFLLNFVNIRKKVEGLF